MIYVCLYVTTGWTYVCVIYVCLYVSVLTGLAYAYMIYVCLYATTSWTYAYMIYECLYVNILTGLNKCVYDLCMPVRESSHEAGPMRT